MKSGEARPPYNFLAKLTANSFNAFPIRVASIQTGVEEAMIACALEKFRLHNGGFPEQLDELIPDYITLVPHDVIAGAPLRYQRQADAKYLLYSIGWNETDDGGLIARKSDNTPGRDHEKSDWVWPSTALE